MKNLKTIVLYSSIIFALGCSSPKTEEKGTDTASMIAESNNNAKLSVDQYIGKWSADEYNGELTINSDGTFKLEYRSPSSVGEGTWDCDSSSITFNKTKGEIYFMSSQNSITFEYYNIFAPVLSHDGPDGHVDLSFSHHNK